MKPLKIAVFGQYNHQNSVETIQTLLDELQLSNCTVLIEKSYFNLLNQIKGWPYELANFNTFENLDSSFNLFISVGGDGTILKSVTIVKDFNIPIIGINTGRLGFLASIQKEDIKHSIQKIMAGDFTISERSLLSLSFLNNSVDELDFALNEITVIRKNTTSMIKVETYLNEEYLTSYWSDGLIISTPTGSTGYSLSCGGPIIEPSSTSLILTPIAPHNLNARPLVIPDNVVIKLVVSGREKKFLASLDSRIITLEQGVSLYIKKASFTIKMIRLKEESFIKTLRKKLLWGEDNRN